MGDPEDTASAPCVFPASWGPGCEKAPLSQGAPFQSGQLFACISYLVHSPPKATWKLEAINQRVDAFQKRKNLVLLLPTQTPSSPGSLSRGSVRPWWRSEAQVLLPSLL